VIHLFVLTSLDYCLDIPASSGFRTFRTFVVSQNAPTGLNELASNVTVSSEHSFRPTPAGKEDCLDDELHGPAWAI